jgi:hypothetical protein
LKYENLKKQKNASGCIRSNFLLLAKFCQKKIIIKIIIIEKEVGEKKKRVKIARFKYWVFIV